MSREEKMRELIQQEQELMREIYGFDKGVAHERERIIKLLESYALEKCDVHCAYSCECFGKYEAQRFIALIKGEQK
jgi:hypothetical protein